MADTITLRTSTERDVVKIVERGPQGPAGGGGGGGSGTVTSVALASSDLTITGSPITTSGTITANITANAVTLEKLQTISSEHLLGRHGGGNGGVQQVGLGTGLTMTGSNVAVTYGITAGTACQGNDSRLSDARTPTAHTHVAADITDLQTNGSAAGLWDLANSVMGLAFSDYQINITDGLNTSALSFPVGEAGVNRAYIFPNADGTVALTSDITKSAVGLGNVTNNAQTQAAIVPNTAPSAGQLLVGNAGGTAYAPASVSGDATLASTGALTIANNAVTNAKLAQIATSTIKGRATSGTGNVEDLSSSQVAAILGLIGAAQNMKVLSPTADYTATSSVTLANVSGLSFTVAANTTYLILTNLQVNCGAGGYNCEISFPSILNNGTTASGFGIQLSGSNSVLGLSTTTATTVKVSNRGTNQTTPSFSILLVRTDSTGGTANFQWAQNAISAASSTLSSNTRALIVPLTT